MIRKDMVDGDWRPAITIGIPEWGPPLDCVLSLEIWGSDIARLIEALFKAKLIWRESDIYIVLNEGTGLALPHLEGILTGVSDLNIFKVFSPEIYRAIDDCYTHRTEQGKNLTGCIVDLTRDRAIVHLSLGMERGVEILNKLYI